MKIDAHKNREKYLYWGEKLTTEFQRTASRIKKLGYHNVFKLPSHLGWMEKPQVAVEKEPFVSSLNKIADILDSRLEEISSKLDDVIASLQNLVIDEEIEEMDE